MLVVSRRIFADGQIAAVLIVSGSTALGPNETNCTGIVAHSSKDFRDRGLIIIERLEEYDGTTAVVRTEHLSAEEVEYRRWKAERGMKCHHLPAAFWRNPLFIFAQYAEDVFTHISRAHFKDVLRLGRRANRLHPLPRAACG